MFLIMPLMFASTIAAESFAGERERKTIEALLYTPASDADLFVGKLIAAAVPSIGITWASFLVYTLILNLIPYAAFQRFWFPLPTWWPLIFWITPALAILSIAVTVLISARVPKLPGRVSAQLQPGHSGGGVICRPIERFSIPECGSRTLAGHAVFGQPLSSWFTWRCRPSTVRR